MIKRPRLDYLNGFCAKSSQWSTFSESIFNLKIITLYIVGIDWRPAVTLHTFSPYGMLIYIFSIKIVEKIIFHTLQLIWNVFIWMSPTEKFSHITIYLGQYQPLVMASEPLMTKYHGSNFLNDFKTNSKSSQSSRSHTMKPIGLKLLLFSNLPTTIQGYPTKSTYISLIIPRFLSCSNDIGHLSKRSQ